MEVVGFNVAKESLEVHEDINSDELVVELIRRLRPSASLSFADLLSRRRRL